ncbi:putative ribonuclease H-like domain-containing protein, partial [Tanacetum coccineum]
MTYTSPGSSSSSDYEVDSCSKSCVKAYATLKQQYNSLSSDYKKFQFNLVSYKAGLESVEARLAHYKKNEAVFEESINVLNLEVKLRDNALVENKKKLEKAEKERDELKLTLEKFQNSSKSLNNLLESQVIDKFKTGLGYNAASSTAASPAVESFVNSSEMLENQEYNKSKSDKGYHAVPLPYTGNFIPFKPDLTFMDEIVENENMDVITIITPSNVKKVESNHESADVKNNDDAVEPKTVRKNSFRPPVIEDWNSDNDSEVEYIPNVEDKTVRASTDKICNPQQKEYKEKGVIDSGCSSHMTGNKCYLTEYKYYDGGFVSFGDGKGRISGKSMSQICDKKNNVLFTNTECLVLSFDFKLLDESQVLLRVLRKDNIYIVDLKSVVPTKGLTCLFAKATIDESNLWHRRLGHINFKNINKLVKGNLVRGLPSKIFENDHSYVACQKGKQHKASCKTKLVNSISKPLHMLHMDLFGPTNVKSLMKKSYYLVVTDDFSRFSWVFFLATKDETSGILKTFITEIENQLDYKVKVIRSDNGTEFKNSVMNQLCEMKGIKREFSVARTPQQNGVAERKNRTLIKAARTMVLVIKPNSKTPYELIHRRTPLIDFMKPFRCPVSILNTRDHLGKFDGKADEGFFCWLFDVDSLSKSMNYVPVVAGNQTNGILRTRDNIVAGPKDSEEDAGVKPTEVDESEASDKDGKDEQDSRSEFERLLQQEKQIEHHNITNSINTVSTHVSIVEPFSTNDAPSSPVNAAKTFEEHLFEQFSPFKNAFTLPDVLNVSPMDDNIGIFAGAYDDEDVGGQTDLNNLETTMNVSSIPITRINKDHPKDQIIGDLNSAILTRRMSQQNLKEHCLEPKKVIQALEDPSWIETMQEELLQFELQKVWTLVDLPNGKRAIGIKWIFRNKKDEEELLLETRKDWLHKIDVKSAFLYGTIEEEVYVCQLPGFEDPHFPDKVYKVEKALYGLHQAPRAWYETLSTYLLENRFRRGTIHKTLFIKKDKSNILLVQVYVDDIIFGSTKKTLLQQNEDGIFIRQDKYVADILKKFYYVTVKTTSTPMEPNKALVKDEEADNVDVHLYRSMIISLMYLTASRPYITFVVCACARFQVTPKTSHLHVVKRIFRYLKGQTKLGLQYLRESPFYLEAFS